MKNVSAGVTQDIQTSTDNILYQITNLQQSMVNSSAESRELRKNELDSLSSDITTRFEGLVGNITTTANEIWAETLNRQQVHRNASNQHIAESITEGLL